MTTREPRFTEQDRAELLALEMYRDGLCPLCGRPVRICTSHEEVGPEFQSTYTVCRATLVRLEKIRGMTDGGKKPLPNSPSYLWSTATRHRR